MGKALSGELSCTWTGLFTIVACDQMGKVSREATLDKSYLLLEEQTLSFQSRSKLRRETKMKIAEFLPLKLYPCSSMVNNTFRTQVERTLLDYCCFGLLLLWHKFIYHFFCELTCCIYCKSFNSQNRIIRSRVSLTSLLRGQLIKCFMTL